MGKNILYKLSDYEPDKKPSDKVMPGLDSLSSEERRYMELTPHLKVKIDNNMWYSGKYLTPERAMVLNRQKNEYPNDITTAHEMTHYMHSMYPIYEDVDKYSRPMDTLKTVIAYLSGRYPGESGQARYHNSQIERLAQTGETALPRFRKAVDTMGKIDQRKIDSLAAGKQLTGESIINEPSFIRALMQDSQFNASPLEDNNNIDMYGNEELRARAKEEAYKRMEKFYAQTYNSVQDKYNRGDTSYVRPPLEELIKGKTAINDLDYNAGTYNYTPGFDYNLQDEYIIPYSDEEEMIDPSLPRKKIRIYSSGDYDTRKKEIRKQQQMLLERANKGKKR